MSELWLKDCSPACELITAAVSVCSLRCSPDHLLAFWIWFSVYKTNKWSISYLYGITDTERQAKLQEGSVSTLSTAGPSGGQGGTGRAFTSYMLF